MKNKSWRRKESRGKKFLFSVGEHYWKTNQY